jgi:DNA-binding response OmpR family regulator
MRVLIIEDDAAIVSALRRGLQKNYVLDVAPTASEGQHCLDTTDYDLILLDLNLPDKEGTELCRDIRAGGIQTPVMILTARTDVTDKVTLLDAGADDYLSKPYSLEELKARMRALMRRESKRIKSNKLAVGDLVIDVASRSVERQGLVIGLRRKEFDLLEYLMRNAGKTLTRQMIMDHVWDMNDSLWTNAIDVHIKYLRDKVDRPFGGRMIKTVHGVGYKLEEFQPAISSRGR